MMSFGYVVARENSHYPPHWRDEDEVEGWLDSLGVSDGYAMRREPGYAFLMYAPRIVFEGLAIALSKFVEARPSTAESFSDLIESLAEDAEGMDAPDRESRFDGIHPWSYSENVVWDFWRLPVSQVKLVADALNHDPSISDHFVGRWDTLHPLSGDVTTARMLLDALERNPPGGDLMRLEATLSHWVRWLDSRNRGL